MRSSLIKTARGHCQAKKHENTYFEFAKRLFQVAPVDAQQILIDFCAGREEVDPIRFLAAFLLVIDPSQPEAVRNAVTDFLVQAQDLCGWGHPSI